MALQKVHFHVDTLFPLLYTEARKLAGSSLPQNYYTSQSSPHVAVAILWFKTTEKVLPLPILLRSFFYFPLAFSRFYLSAVVRPCVLHITTGSHFCYHLDFHGCFVCKTYTAV